LIGLGNIEQNKAILEEMVERATLPVVQKLNVAIKVPGQHLSSRWETPSHWVSFITI